MLDTKVARGEEIVLAYVAKHEYTPGHFPGFENIHPGDLESFMGDIVADILHYGASRGMDTDRIHHMGMLHFTDEQTEAEIEAATEGSES